MHKFAKEQDKRTVPDVPDYGVKPQRLLKDDIIYEVSLGGLSMFDASISEAERGTFKGAARQVTYLQELGITAIEFLPIHEFMVSNYCSPNPQYSSDKSPDGPTREFKKMVKAFHQAGIKVFLDVVYDYTVVKSIIMDSLQHWTLEMGVDGFCFDIAPILSVTKDDSGCPTAIHTTMFENISKTLPSRGNDFARGVDVIVKPWGEDLEWQDKIPWDWAVWNKNFGDVLKTSFNKYGINPLSILEIAKVLLGSKAFVKKRPWNSINYFVSHADCNSLRDIFSENQIFHVNEDQLSWDQGGDSELQKKAVRNAFVLLLLSPGVPMFVGGDEGTAFQFVKRLIEFRRRHECLRPAEYFEGKINPRNGFGDLTWHREDGAEITGENWDETDFIAYRFNAGGQKIQHKAEGVSSIYIAYNRSPRERRIIFPPNLPHQGWYRVLDTDNTGGWMSETGNFDDGKVLLDRTYTLHERSILVLVEKEKEGDMRDGSSVLF